MKDLVPGGEALLRKALAAIKAHPKSFNMGGWMDHDPAIAQPRERLAGHIVLAAGFPAIDGSTYEIAKLPAPLRPLAKRAAFADNFVSIRDLATYLVVGGDRYQRYDMEEELFYGHEQTPAQIERTVDKWLAASWSLSAT